MPNPHRTRIVDGLMDFYRHNDDAIAVEALHVDDEHRDMVLVFRVDSGGTILDLSPQQARDLAIALVKAANVLDTTAHLFVVEAPADTRLLDGLLAYNAIRAGTDWTDKGILYLGTGRDPARGKKEG
jgi:hypothetical protein